VAREQGTLYPPVANVGIDLRPGCNTNWLVVGAPELVPVAIYGTDNFAPQLIDVATLRLAGAPIVTTALADVNGDSKLDLTATFQMSAMNISAGTTSVILAGKFFSSLSFQSETGVTIVAHVGPIVAIHNDGTGYSRSMNGPFNHAWVNYSLTDCVDSVYDNCGNPLSINVLGTITRITSDEAGADQMQILGNSTFRVRRERDGGGDVRVYTTWFDISDAYGGVTTASCRVQVRHDTGGVDAGDGAPIACVGSCVNYQQFSGTHDEEEGECTHEDGHHAQ